MASKFDSLNKEVEALVTRGQLLYDAISDSFNILPEDYKQDLVSRKIKLPDFFQEYESWYSEALRVVKQIIPDRTEDFVKLYKNEKRKNIDPLSYCISDYLLGLNVSRFGEATIDGRSAIPKVHTQVSILKSAKRRFESALFDIHEVLQADLFDSELDAAYDLTKKGFVRAGGAMAGVVLEKHLGHVSVCHGLKSKKAHPNISDFDQLLKDAAVIDTPMWRFVQHLSDIRNLCDHKKEREPTKEEVLEMVEGVEKVIKALF